MSNEQVTHKQIKALLLATFAWASCFAVWTLFSILGLKIKATLLLSDFKYGILIATPILTGSISRLYLGILAAQYGGRIVALALMIIASVSLWMLPLVSNYAMYLVVALGLGIAGGFFAVGVSYVSRWAPKTKQGTFLGFFGVGAMGSAVTSFATPLLLLKYGFVTTVHIYAGGLGFMALFFWLFSESEPVNSSSRSVTVLDYLVPLKNMQVWRFSIYYFFVFGGFVALTLWLPKYYIGVYGVDLKMAGFLTSLFALSGSVFRAIGGILSDKFGARKIMYFTFIISVLCTFILSYPATDYVVHGINGEIKFTLVIGMPLFVCLSMFLGMVMSFGMAAVYKHIPVYYPEYVGVVGGAVSLVGGLGGFILPIMFGLMNDVIGIWTSCFMLLFALVSIALIWMHFAILSLDKQQNPGLRGPKDLPELQIK